MMPAMEMSMRKTPIAMTGFSRKRSHSVVPWRESQIPAMRMGMERMNVMMLRIPTRLLLSFTIFVELGFEKLWRR